MRTICQDTGSFERSPHFHLFNKQSLFQGVVCCVCLCGQDSGYVLTALPTELHQPRGRRWDSNPRQVNLHNAFAVGVFERGEPPCRFRGPGGVKGWRGWRRRNQDTFVPHLCTCRTCIWHKLFWGVNQCSCWMCLLFAHGGDKTPFFLLLYH